MLKKYKDINGKKIAVLGLAFKPNTDDMREAPSITVTDKLLSNGAIVTAYDPVATDNAKKVLSSNVKYAESIEEAIDGADLVMILTEWADIKGYPLESYKNYMKQPVIFDGRNCHSLESAKKSGVVYHSIGRPSMNG